MRHVIRGTTDSLVLAVRRVNEREASIMRRLSFLRVQTVQKDNTQKAA